MFGMLEVSERFGHIGGTTLTTPTPSYTSSIAPILSDWKKLTWSSAASSPKKTSLQVCVCVWVWVLLVYGIPAAILGPSPMTFELPDRLTCAGVPLLVFANKQDLLSALSAADISLGLNLHAIKDRAWQVQACSAKAGEGLAEGLEWLIKVVGDKAAAAGGKAGSAAGAGAGAGAPAGGGSGSAAAPPS